MNNKNNRLELYLFPVCLILILSFSRIIPHPSNFTPILAVGIFSGFYFKNFISSFFIVVFSMFLGDLYLGFHGTMFFTYISLAIAVAIGIFIKNFKFNPILLGGLTSSFSFFIITNFGSWLTLDMYEKNFSGLMQSYFLAIPFFHNTLASTILYLVIIKLLLDFAIKKQIVKISF